MVGYGGGMGQGMEKVVDWAWAVKCWDMENK